MILFFLFEFGCVVWLIGKGNFGNYEICRNGVYVNFLNSWKFILVSELMIMSYV